jgi:hypothetical protein
MMVRWQPGNLVKQCQQLSLGLLRKAGFATSTVWLLLLLLLLQG